MDNKAIAEQLVKRCLAKGADAAEVYIESGRNLSLDVRKGDIETVQEAAAAGAGIRVFVQGRMAFASSNDLGEKALEEAAGRAIAFAKATTADPNNVLPGDKGVTEVAGLYDPLRLYIIKYIDQYKQLTRKETGKVGPLYYPCVGSYVTALVFAIIYLIAR